VLHTELRGLAVSEFFFFCDAMKLHMVACLMAILFFCTPLSAAQTEEAGQPHLPSDPWIVRTRALFEQGAHEEIHRLLRHSSPNHLDHVDVLFQRDLRDRGGREDGFRG